MRVFEIGVVEEERAECVRDGPDKNTRARDTRAYRPNTRTRFRGVKNASVNRHERRVFFGFVCLCFTQNDR